FGTCLRIPHLEGADEAAYESLPDQGGSRVALPDAGEQKISARVHLPPLDPQQELLQDKIVVGAAHRPVTLEETVCLRVSAPAAGGPRRQQENLRVVGPDAQTHSERLLRLG